MQRRKIKASKKKKGATKIYDDDELDAESEYDSVGSADLDKMIARQICMNIFQILFQWKTFSNINAA